MNPQNADLPPTAAASSPPEVPAGARSEPAGLPDLTDEAVDRMEDAVFARIADERATRRATATDRSRTRRRRWLTAGGVAAAFAAGVLITPPILGSVAGVSSSASPEILPGWAVAPSSGGSAPNDAAPMPGAPAQGLESAKSGSAGSASADSSAPREIVQTGSATIRVDDVRAAADALITLAEKHGGRVESMTIGATAPGQDPAAVPGEDDDRGWLSLRVPASDLQAVMVALGEHGRVEATSLGESDVTEAAVDLRARIDSAAASVQRLTELMAKAGSVSELLEAEVALTDRQAQLESARQQLKDLESQVTMSSLQISLTRTTAPAADPAGFGDGLAAGWAGLIASVNALVIASGFLLPWLGVAVVIALLLWGVVRLIHHRRRGRRTPTEEPEAPEGR
ncbi:MULTISPECIES: DUF4349 domain-containing protein [Bacteria]|uniref:DUF4349 domain-containing protein n=1 Tax=Bacteria TaxID=2 RepID=UPI003C7CD166